MANRRPILGNGEFLIDPIIKKQGFGQKAYPRSYESARELVQSELTQLNEVINLIPDSMKMDKVVAVVKLSSEFLAKSYTPNTFFREFEFENIGSREWQQENGEIGRMNFIKFNPDVINQNMEKLYSVQTDNFKNELREIEEIDLLSTEEKIFMFDDWSSGRVELILHPYEDETVVLNKLFDLLNLDAQDSQHIRVKAYEKGPIFVSIKLNKQDIDLIKEFNPLRSAHPMKVSVNSFSEESVMLEAKLPDTNKPVLKKVGVIDGGVNLEHPFFCDKVTQQFQVTSRTNDYFGDHGTAVAGLILYGDLNNYGSGPVEGSNLGIESIRVFPTSDQQDIDLYECIDLIEEAIPLLPEIDVFNISIGPIGFIFDEDISRFTFAMDKLAYDYDKLFVVAVGNTGTEMYYPLNRIAAPADMVNGIAVGAYDFNDETLVRASYSSVGYGREGGKVKPDICEFGGTEETPLLVFDSAEYSARNVMGTSFAAPIVTRKLGEIMLSCNEINIRTARALLIQNASNSPNEISRHLGFGKCIEKVEDVLNCDENKVTIIYENEMSVKSYAKLNIPLPSNASANKFKISWTIVVQSNPNPLFVQEYTSIAIEDVFYPHEAKFTLTFPDGRKKRIMLDTTEYEEYMGMEGIKISQFPITSSPKKYSTETESRETLKWDTVIKKEISHNAISLKKPFIVVHALDRETDIKRVKYSVAVTVEAVGYAGDLYQEIVNEYPLLTPIRIRQEQHVEVPNIRTY